MKITRRSAIKNFVATSALAATGIYFPQSSSAMDIKTSQRINHSVCRWCFNDIPLEALCEYAQSIGIQSIDLLTIEESKIAIKYGLTCAMAYGSSFGLTEGFNDENLHEQLWKEYEKNIPLAAELGLKNVICFSGNANGLSSQEGLENCAKGLEPVLKLAQKYGVTVSMELLNSTVDHPDYQCDHTAWGVALAEKMGMPNFKLLYDIYHMQIMEGNVIATIRENKDYISHYHTAGVPGRNEIDQSQELYYPAIMKAIADTGYKGYVAQEFIPTNEDPLVSLKKSIDICNI